MYLFASVCLGVGAACAAPLARPNFVIIFTDDQGYQDLGCFGSPDIKTPRIDQMAKEGMRFTNFYAQTVCGPSRAALMTGCYPLRLARQADPDSIHPELHINEITIAEVLREQGYATAAFGKWDLAGHDPAHYKSELLPPNQGFDYYFGTSGSNDHTVNLIRNTEMVEKKADMSTLTKRYTDEAIRFIERRKDAPFFVYLAHTMPHTKLAASKAFMGKSAGGLYGDVIEELDFNVGRLLDKVKELGLDDKTYIIFTSDNGPEWTGKRTTQDDNSTGRGLGTYYSVGETAGLKGQKRSLFAGGIRVPFIARWPGVIPKGRIDRTSVLTGVDLFPTFLELAGQSIPADLKLDGESIVTALKGLGFKRTKPIHWEWRGGHGPPYLWPHLGIRDGKWKMLVNQELNRAELYDIEADWAETNNVAADNPDLVNALTEKVLAWKRSLPTKPPFHCFSRLRTEKSK